MNGEQVLAQVRELEEIINRLNAVRDSVNGFRVGQYRDAGKALWAGQQRTRFISVVDTAISDHAQIGVQIGQAISDCKSRQHALAFSINPLEHPILSAQAVTIALN